MPTSVLEVLLRLNTWQERSKVLRFMSVINTGEVGGQGGGGAGKERATQSRRPLLQKPIGKRCAGFHPFTDDFK